MFIATVHKAERKTVVESDLFSDWYTKKGVFLQLSSPSWGLQTQFEHWLRLVRAFVLGAIYYIRICYTVPIDHIDLCIDSKDQVLTFLLTFICGVCHVL